MNISKIKRHIVSMYEANTSSKLTYHGFHHVLDVLNSCNQHLRRLKITGKDAHLLRVAALLHDIGILWSYKNHEQEGIKYAKTWLPNWGYSKQDIEKVCNMISATQLPQDPKNILEKIICDADLDYLGTDKFYDIGETLFKEFVAFDVVKNEKEWDELQVAFLKKHSYHTNYSKVYREPQKRKRIVELVKKWA